MRVPSSNFGQKTGFAPKFSSDIRSAARELFTGPHQSLPEMSDGPTAIGEHCLVIAKFKYLTFDPLGGVKGNAVNFDTAMLIYRHLAIMVYTEKLLNIIALMKCEDHHTKKAYIGFAV